ncbi:hypothetical protein [Anatilimnocola floriformis]|uniref:hypothetical protein n=1 Tax=Anatilimnocola floriformis TaxID=2948575 RepID=UPI0020C20332|nr:hypothetical protein [Anatilimnocola floriformis]
MKITLRELFLLTVIVALTLGWHAHDRRMKAERLQVQAEWEQERRQLFSTIADQMRAEMQRANARFFSQSKTPQTMDAATPNTCEAHH